MRSDWQEWLARLPADREARVEVCEECPRSHGDYPEMVCELIVKEVRTEHNTWKQVPCAIKLARLLETPIGVCPESNHAQRERFARAVPMPKLLDDPHVRPYTTEAEVRSFFKAVKRHERTRRRGPREKRARFRVTPWEH